MNLATCWILPYRTLVGDSVKYQYLLVTKSDCANLSAISFEIEQNNPEEVVRKLYDATGYLVEPEDMISLGGCRPNDSLWTVDISGRDRNRDVKTSIAWTRDIHSSDEAQVYMMHTKLSIYRMDLEMNRFLQEAPRD